MTAELLLMRIVGVGFAGMAVGLVAMIVDGFKTKGFTYERMWLAAYIAWWATFCGAVAWILWFDITVS